MALAPHAVEHNNSNCRNRTKGGEEDEADQILREQQLGEEIETGDTPKRYVPLCDLYSATSPCVNGGIMSKKVKARKMVTLKTAELILDQLEPQHRGDEEDHRHTSSDLKSPTPPTSISRPPFINFYTRRPKRARHSSDIRKLSIFDSFVPWLHSQSSGGPSSVAIKEEEEEQEEEGGGVERAMQKNKHEKNKPKELINTSVDSSTNLQIPRLRESRNHHSEKLIYISSRRRKNIIQGNCQNLDHLQMLNPAIKRWVGLSFAAADSKNLVGLQCKVYWPLDDDWYTGHVVGYNEETGRHHVSYVDGDEEDIIILNESIKFYISHEEMCRLNLNYHIGTLETNGLQFSEMVVLAASFDDCLELGLGDIIWAKISGHAMWPAIVVDESCLRNCKGLNNTSVGKSVAVQFFGTHDFARVNRKQIISFLQGLLSSFHLKCKKPNFVQSLKEAKMYLSELKLPGRMIREQTGMEADDGDSASQDDEDNADSGEDCRMGLTNSVPFSKSSLSKVTSQGSQDLPIGYRPVLVKWKDLDKCNVCHMDEEYENNLFLQCDKCRMMVHAKCYGELEPVDGVLWLCKLCRPGAPNLPPPCCLCPLIGGAMKPTTDGRWAHLACAIWIPETCLSDVKKMEPIDGLSRINKDRWKLLCSICGVSYGACIQCSNNTCRVAYHPLCARAAGFCAELEDEGQLHLISMDEDEDEQCIRLLSFCKKHRLPSTERLATDDRNVQTARQCSGYSPPSNPSGCARSEPYNYFGRRGRKEPEALAAASLKRLFVENRPYMVGGSCQHEALGYTLSPTTGLAGSKFSFSLQKLRSSQHDDRKCIHSMAEKYKCTRETFRKRLAFGKSGIHGFGIFAKQPHRAGDMVIEYTGELVRPPIADRREHLIYNSLVGAGTYMFRIDDERVIDATRAGSIAHLINHSCEPNCYSRVISVSGEEHIIIFAKRDIKQWEELTYDYRFFSIDEQLACYCCVPRCRGVVNDIDAEEQVAKLYVSRSELRDWV